MRCNTVTFTSADGKDMSFPLEPLIERGALVVSKINGESASEVMGAINQLWIPGFPAKYFARDIIDIRFSEENEPPEIEAFRNDGHDFTNRPNVSARGPRTAYVGESLQFEGWASDFDQKICAIQISLDEGDTWTTYETKGTDETRWVTWTYEYPVEKPGLYRLKARAVNERGDVSPIAAVHDFEVLPVQDG